MYAVGGSIRAGGVGLTVSSYVGNADELSVVLLGAADLTAVLYDGILAKSSMCAYCGNGVRVPDWYPSSSSETRLDIVVLLFWVSVPASGLICGVAWLCDEL